MTNALTTVVAAGPGIGDAMILSAIAHQWTLSRPGIPLRLVSAHPELLLGWPDVESVAGPCGGALATFQALHDPAMLREHQIAVMLRQLGLPVPEPTEVRCYFSYRADDGDLFDSLDEQLAGTMPVVTMHVQPGAWTRTKDWIDDGWDTVAESLVAKLGAVAVWQLGAATDRRLPGVRYDFMGAPLRQVAMLLERSSLHVGCISGMMHVASAVGTPSVIVAGGRENPRVTCYPTDRVLSTLINCSPCWLVSPCPYGTPQPCMADITADAVLDAIGDALCRAPARKKGAANG